MADRKVFVDTWGWLTLADQREQAHAALIDLRRQHSAGNIGWLTSDYVLDETITRLFSRVPFERAKQFADGMFAAHKAGALAIEFITPERFAAAYRLRARFRDKPRISFTDLTSFALMKELGVTGAITGDDHYVQANLGFHVLPQSRAAA